MELKHSVHFWDTRKPTAYLKGKAIDSNSARISVSSNHYCFSKNYRQGLSNKEKTLIKEYSPSK